MGAKCRIVLATLTALAVLGAPACESSSDPAKASPSTSAPPAPATTKVPAAPPVPEPAPAAWAPVGQSALGKPIRALTIGHGPRKVVFIGGIHGDEPEGAVIASELPSAFEAAGLSGAVTLTIIEDANPDGRAAGTRTNANGVDVNRNFPASNFDPADGSNGGTPLSEPESRAVAETIDRTAPNLVIVAHSWAGRQFINFDGPAREIADRFSAASGLPVEESSAFAPTPGSLGSYFGRDRQIPTLTIEVLKGSDPVAVWEQLRPALLEAIAG